MTASTTTEARLSANQRGAIMGHFARLGFNHPAHRPGRLVIMAALLGVARIGSVNELDHGQAGRLVAILGTLRDTRALAVHLAMVAAKNLIQSETETNGTPS